MAGLSETPVHTEKSPKGNVCAQCEIRNATRAYTENHERTGRPLFQVF